MTRLRGPYSVAFPVNFTSRGDTTRDAFRKHMDEITRIYGILTGLDADTMDSTAVSQMLKNWKPSMSFSDISGNLDASRVSGALTGATIDGSKVTGTIAASKVSGKLTNANIDTGKVNGLEAFVKGLLPNNEGTGITESSLSTNGYVKFTNGFLIQWGKTKDQNEYVHPSVENEATFVKEFASSCYGVIAQVCHNGVDQTLGAMTSVTGISRTGFKYIHEKFSASYGGGPNPWYLRYIALGV